MEDPAKSDIPAKVLGLCLCCEQSFAASHSDVLSSWSASPETLATVLRAAPYGVGHFRKIATEQLQSDDHRCQPSDRILREDQSQIKACLQPAMNKSASTDGLERPVSLDLRRADLGTCGPFEELALPVLCPAARSDALQARQASMQLGAHPATPVKTKPRIERNRVLVTGGAGFVGSHLCTFLVERGDHVRSLAPP